MHKRFTLLQDALSGEYGTGDLAQLIVRLELSNGRESRCYILLSEE